MRFDLIQQYREWKCKEHLWKFDDYLPKDRIVLKAGYWYRCERCGKSKSDWNPNKNGLKGEL